jgi:chromosomal replication initiation ATPase DnaA
MYEWEDIKTAVELTKKGLSINDIKKFLDYEQEPVITPYNLLNVICNYFNVHPKLVKGNNRDRKYVIVRKMFSYFACIKFNVIQNDVAFILNKNRSSLVHYNKSIQDFIDIKDPETINNINNINDLINNGKEIH